MTDLQTAAQQVLDYWESVGWGDAVMVDKMDALRAALAQQAEPEKECHKRRNDPCACSRKALLCDGFGPPQQAEFTEPVQEPVAWMCSSPELMAKGYKRFSSRCEGDWNIPVYTAPPQRKPLTEEEIDKIFKHLCNTVGASYKTMTRAVERAHGIKERV